MSTEPISTVRPSLRLRADTPVRPWYERTGREVAAAAVAAMALGFVVLGAPNLELGALEARLGIATGNPFGPLGHGTTGWDPFVWPIPLALSQGWAAFQSHGLPTQDAVRWPTAIAAVLTGWILTRRMLLVQGPTAAIFSGLAFFGTVALMDRSGAAGLDMISGLAVVAAIDRFLTKGTDWVAGLWAALAFLSAGWVPVAILALSTIVLGRTSARLSFRFLAPPIAAMVGWSVWTVKVANPTVWAAGLTLPFTQASDWWLPVALVGLTLPWSPMILLLVRKDIRSGWEETPRKLVVGWLQVGAATLVLGTAVPGFAVVAATPVLAALAIAVGMACERIWSIDSELAQKTRDHLRTLTVGVTLTWALICVIFGSHVAMAISYYRVLAVFIIASAMVGAGVAMAGAIRDRSRWSLLSLVVMALGLKLGHSGYFVPEWNYRQGQGPWGRAIGQWVPPRRTVFTLHPWPNDLAFAIGRPVRQILSPNHIQFQQGGSARYVLLQPSEFENWPESAPSLVKVREFQDEIGDPRILARTDGPIDWDGAARDSQ